MIRDPVVWKVDLGGRRNGDLMPLNTGWSRELATGRQQAKGRMGLRTLELTTEK